MIINGKALLDIEPIEGMIPTKQRAHGLSHGLSEVGYDIRIKQSVFYTPPNPYHAMQLYDDRNKYKHNIFKRKFDKAFFGFTRVVDGKQEVVKIGRTAIASSIEPFNIPKGLWCKFSNKSTLARCFVDPVNGTDGEPGWKGHLTIELIFHDIQPMVIPAGSGVMKAVFQKLTMEADYGSDGKYQNQPDQPVPALFV